MVTEDTGDRGLGTGRYSAGHMPVRGGYLLPMRALVFFALVALGSPVAHAQSSKGAEKSSKSADKNESIPKQYMPPAGMCRIWVDNVPAARQPAPTNCETAIRNRPPNARVIFPEGKGGASKSLVPRQKGDTGRRKPPKE